jgi:hypothetical protein
VRRRDAVGRWRRAIADGLTAEEAARAVGVPRSTLYRWEKAPQPQSRRPHARRKPQWTRELAQAVAAARADNPMWGKRKIAVLMRREGFQTSASTVGRILASLVARGAIIPVPVLRRRPAARRFKFSAREGYARRLPKGRKARSPGELVQIDTLFVNVRPDAAIKHFTAYDPVAKWTIGRVPTRASAASASALLDQLIAEAPFRVRGIQVDGGAEFRAEFEAQCQARKLELLVLPPSARTSTAASSAPRPPGVTSSTPATACPTASINCRPSSMPSPTDSTTTDPTMPLAAKLPQSISGPKLRRTPAVSYALIPDNA